MCRLAELLELGKDELRHLRRAAELRAQHGEEAPGSRQPAAPAKPRIAPVLEAQWNDVQRQLVAKHVDLH